MVGSNNPNLPDNVRISHLVYADTSYLGAVSLPDDPYTPIFTGSGAAYDRGQVIPNSGGYGIGGSSTPVADYGNGDLRPRISRQDANLLSHFDVSDALKLSVEGQYTRTNSYSLGQPNFDYYTALTLDNPYIPSNVVAAANAAADSIGVAADDAAGRAIYVTRDNLDSPMAAPIPPGRPIAAFSMRAAASAIMRTTMPTTAMVKPTAGSTR